MSRPAALVALCGALALGGCAATDDPGAQRPDNGLAPIVTNARDAPGSLAPVGPDSAPGNTDIVLPATPRGPTTAGWRRAADPICRRLSRARARGDRRRAAAAFGDLARVSVPPAHLRRWIAFLNAEAQRSAALTPPGLPPAAKRFFAQRRKAGAARSRAALHGLGFRRCGR